MNNQNKIQYNTRTNPIITNKSSNNYVLIGFNILSFLLISILFIALTVQNKSLSKINKRLDTIELDIKHLYIRNDDRKASITELESKL
jgi:hypothetical protein